MTERPFYTGGWLVVGLAAALLSGCVRPEPAAMDAHSRFQLLHERRLSDFEREIAVEHRTGPDAWTAVGDAWLELATCDNPTGFVDPPRTPHWDGAPALAHVLYETLVLENRPAKRPRHRR